MGLTLKERLQHDLESGDATGPATPSGGDEQRIAFFGGRFKRKEATWVVSLFVLLHLVVFAATMFVNDCPRASHGDCSVVFLRRFAFQPLSENPLLGPASSTMLEMGALQRELAIQHNQKWRLVTFTWLHAGVIHLALNLPSVVFLGLRLEQAFGPVRVGAIYLLSSLVGGFLSLIFVEERPSVGSSGALFGLLGSLFVDLIRNWQIYSDKAAGMSLLLSVGVINFALGLLPYIDNYANIGGLFSGVVLGVMLLYNPQLGMKTKGLYEFQVNTSVALKHQLDKPFLRVMSLVVFGLIISGGLFAAIHNVDANEHCPWCHYIDCIPSKGWSCFDRKVACEAIVDEGRLTLTCLNKGTFHVYPFADVSQGRISDLCSQICS